MKHTRDEGHGVLATVLGGLEDIRLNTSEGWVNGLAGMDFDARQGILMGVHLAGTERPTDEAAEALLSRVYREQRQVSEAATNSLAKTEITETRKRGNPEKAKPGRNLPVQAVRFWRTFSSDWIFKQRDWVRYESK